jgi:hypothetical protein
VTRARLQLTLVLLGAAALAPAAADSADGGAAAPPGWLDETAAGPIVDEGEPPAQTGRWTGACSQHHPLCVRAAPGTDDAVTLAALDAADRAWNTLTGVLDLPPPDAPAGGGWPVYLVDGVDGAGTARLAGRDPLARFDRGSSFALVDRATPPGCPLDLAMARAVARGSLWRAAPATDPGSARAESEMLARLAVACAPPDDDAAAFQSEPERAVVDPVSAAFDRGASMFFEWLDATYGAQPGALVLGLWALAPTRTPAAAWRWSGRPTGFDVLRASLAGALWTGSTLDDVLAAFSAARATATPPPRLAWRVPWPDHPRRFLSAVPPAPTGASYVLVNMAGRPAGAALHAEAEWEDYGRMRWTAVKIAHGRAAAVLPVTSPDRATRAATTIDLLDGVDAVMLVGTHVGSTEHPFDPDQGVWEPHGWLLTIEGE